MELLDGPADQRFQVLLTVALKSAGGEMARARKISLGELIRRSLASDVDRYQVSVESKANGGIHPSHDMGEWHQTLRNDRFARQRECRLCELSEYTTVAGDGRHLHLPFRCMG